MRLKRRLSTIRPAFQMSLRASRSRSWLRAVTSLIPSRLYLLRTCLGTSTSTLKRDIQRSIDPQRHASGGGCKSSSPGSARASGEDDSSSCLLELSKHACALPLLSDTIHRCSRSRSRLCSGHSRCSRHTTPFPRSSTLRTTPCFPRASSLVAEHIAPAYNHIPYGGEEHNE